MNTKFWLGMPLTAIIAGLTGATTASIGQTSTVTYNWTLPVEMFILLTVPAVLGYFIGKEDK